MELVPPWLSPYSETKFTDQVFASVEKEIDKQKLKFCFEGKEKGRYLQSIKKL